MNSDHTQATIPQTHGPDILPSSNQNCTSESRKQHHDHRYDNEGMLANLYALLCKPALSHLLANCRHHGDDNIAYHHGFEPAGESRLISVGLRYERG